MGMDDRQEYHPTQASASMSLGISGDGRGGELSEDPLVPQNPPCSHSLLDQARPALRMGMHIEKPRQPWEPPPRMEIRRDARDMDLTTVKPDTGENVRDYEPQPRPYTYCMARRNFFGGKELRVR